MYICSKNSLNRPKIGHFLNGPSMGGGRFRELEYLHERLLGTDIKRSILGSGQSVEMVG